VLATQAGIPDLAISHTDAAIHPRAEERTAVLAESPLLGRREGEAESHADFAGKLDVAVSKLLRRCVRRMAEELGNLLASSSVLLARFSLLS